MKQLRRAIAATATVAALAAPGPIALLSASAAYASPAFANTTASATDPQPSPEASEGTYASPASSPAPSSDGATPGQTTTDSPTGPADTPPPTDSPPPTDTGTTTPAPQDSPPRSTPGTSRPPSTDIGDPIPVPSNGSTPGQNPASEGGETADHSGETVPGDTWSPSHCTDFIPDDSLSVDVTGLPSKIVAGSGWHPFTFSVANHTGAALSNVYVQSFTEYATGVNEQASLQLDLAQLQFHDPSTGRWTDAFQDYYEDGTGRHPYRGTFVALVRDLGKGERVDLHLRVRVVPTAPAGAGFALSTAVYAGQGGSCNINGDTYNFTVLKAGSNPGRVDDAKPTGEKPTDGAHPQGGAQIVPFGGDLADTGTSEAVPVIGLIGALAVIVGAILVFASRRRGMALAEATEAAETMPGTASLTAPRETANAAGDPDEAPGSESADGPSDSSHPPVVPEDDEDGEGGDGSDGSDGSDGHGTDRSAGMGGTDQAGAADGGASKAASPQTPITSEHPEHPEPPKSSKSPESRKSAEKSPDTPGTPEEHESSGDPESSSSPEGTSGKADTT